MCHILKVRDRGPGVYWVDEEPGRMEQMKLSECPLYSWRAGSFWTRNACKNVTFSCQRLVKYEGLSMKESKFLRNLDLGEKNSCSNMLVIPSECVIELRGAENLAIRLNVAQVGWVLGGLVQPSSSP